MARKFVDMLIPAIPPGVDLATSGLEGKLRELCTAVVPSMRALSDKESANNNAQWDVSVLAGGITNQLYKATVSNKLAKEKSVIIEEIKMYHDLPQYQVLELLDEFVYSHQLFLFPFPQKVLRV